MNYLIHFASSIAFYIYSFVMFEKIYTSKRHHIATQLLCLLLASVGMTLVQKVDIPVVRLVYSFSSMIILNIVLKISMI